MVELYWKIQAFKYFAGLIAVPLAMLITMLLVLVSAIIENAKSKKKGRKQ